jgi:hypothetical protein
VRVWLTNSPHRGNLFAAPHILVFEDIHHSQRGPDSDWPYLIHFKQRHREPRFYVV